VNKFKHRHHPNCNLEAIP